MGKPQRDLKRRITQSIVTLLTVMAVTSVLLGSQAFAQSAGDPNTTVGGKQLTHQMPKSEANVKYGLIAAAAAFGLGAIGAGIAIAHVGAAAMGAVAEKPQIAGQALIFVALAEGLVVFGFITAIMILNKI